MLNHQILASSIEPDQDMKEHILDKKPISKGQIIREWLARIMIISSQFLLWAKILGMYICSILHQ